MIYNLTCNVYLNGRSSLNGVVNFPAGSTLTTGFKPGDVLQADQESLDPNGITKWYKITSCMRSGVSVVLPNPVWASNGGTLGYLTLNGIVTDPTPVPTFPNEVWLSMTPTGERKRYVLVP